jgi:hypothetical protein
MAKKQCETRMVSYGIYSEFDRDGRDLPKFLEPTWTIPVAMGVEFGYVLEIKKARGQFLTFEIDHPSFLDSRGNPAGPFTGEIRIPHSTWRFFLGDTFWLPLEDKVGKWRLRVWIAGDLVADKTFTMVL